MTHASTLGYLSAATMLLLLAGTSGPTNASTFAHAGTSTGGTWGATGSLHTARVAPMAATLTSGKVLVAGGFNASATLASAELYDPATAHWSRTGAMLLGRYTATMTLLTNGKVLVAGGRFNGSPGVTTETELYDPTTGKWSSTGSMTVPRASHTATLLANGKVLVAGGVGVQQADSIASAELYDPATGKWSKTSDMSTGRERHTATQLANGKVLVTGGSLDYLDGAEGSTESYDPRTGAWTVVGRMMTSRFSHTATALSDGTVLVAGGSYGNFAASNAVAMTDRYDPRNLRWSPMGDMQIAAGSVPAISGREAQTATLLQSGQVLVAGGDGYLSNFKRPAVIFSTAELFDPSLGTWTLTGSMRTARVEHAAVALADGRVLVVGGSGNHAKVLGTAEVYTPSANGSTAAKGSHAKYISAVLGSNNGHAYPEVSRANVPGVRAHRVSGVAALIRAVGSWTQTGAMHVARVGAPATLLPNGRVLVEGCATTGAASKTAELYDPIHGTWSMTGSMQFPRCNQVAILLRDGRVLVAGGDNFAAANVVWSSAEIYDPKTGSWSSGGHMNSTRYWASIFLLASGKVLVAGGNAVNGIPRDSADLYDPKSGTWTATPCLNLSRNIAVGGAATLSTGRALVQGGFTQNSTLTLTGELYDPVSNAWTFTGSTAQQTGQIVSVSNGNVLSTDEHGNPTPTSELYTPASGTWAPTAGNMHFPRANDAATELADGRALISGGCFGVSSCVFIAQAEIFDPKNQMWSLDAPLITPREEHSAALLADGRVLVAGGLNANLQPLSSAELYMSSSSPRGSLRTLGASPL